MQTTIENVKALAGLMFTGAIVAAVVLLAEYYGLELVFPW